MYSNAIEKIESTLDYLTSSFEFNSFTKYVLPYEDIPINAEVEGLSFLKKYKGGNCINFGKALIEIASGIPNLDVYIIGALPQLDKCSQTQADFIQYGHTAVMLKICDELYLAEPTMRLNRLIPIQENARIENSEQVFIIKNVTTTDFELLTSTKSKFNIDSKNKYRLKPLINDQFNDLGRRLRLIERNLSIVNCLNPKIPRYNIKYNVQNNLFKTNIEGVPSELSWDDLLKYKNKVNNLFLAEDTMSFLGTLMENYVTFKSDLVV